MKKIIIIIISALCFSLAANAQLVSSSSLIVTKSAFPEIKPGWRNNIEVGYKLGVEDYSYVGADYSFGYRFNKSIYLGALIGFDYALNTEIPSIVPDGKLSPNAINFPLCVDFKCYFPIQRVLPFIQLNAGARLAPNMTAKFGSKDVIYNTTGLIINPKIGIAYRVAKKTDIYISAGYCAQTRKKGGSCKEFQY